MDEGYKTANSVAIEDRDVSPITLSMENLSEITELLRDKIFFLRDRLSPVLRDNDQNVAHSDVKPAPPASEIRYFMENKTSTIRSMADDLTDILDRLEL